MTARDHGTYSTYSNWKCRCQRCKDAHADYMRDYRLSGKEKPHNGVRRAAYKAAESRLRQAHPEEFAAFYADECDRRGLS